MVKPSRRNIFQTLVAGAVLSPASAGAAAIGNCPVPDTPAWGIGIEGQRKADLGDGLFLNPIIPGDHPDPTILKDGDDYYLTCSSFFSYPGLIIWHSTDLVNWAPIGPALFKPLGTIWAVDLCRYFIYIPAAPDSKPWSIYAIWADDIRGPWSDPVDLNIHDCIDPGHVVGEDGRRYLFVNGVRRIRLSDDGLTADGELEPAYSPWHYPDDWITENFAPEGPKLLRHGDYFYLITAVGGTAALDKRRRAQPVAQHRRALEIHQRSLGTQPVQSDRADDRHGGTLVVAGPCDHRAGAGWRLVAGLSWLRKRLSHSGPANPSRTNGMDRRRLVQGNRRRPFTAASQA